MLRVTGHDVVTARELGLEHASDDEHLLTAAQQVRILVSHNRADFVLLHDAWQRWASAWQVGARHGGILILPQQLSVTRIAEVLANLLEAGPPMDNELHEWRVSTGWVRR